jgi:hypothetical protein
MAEFSMKDLVHQRLRRLTPEQITTPRGLTPHPKRWSEATLGYTV